MKLTISITTMPSRSESLAKLVSSLGFDLVQGTDTDWIMGRLLRWVDEVMGVEVLAYSTPPYNDVDDRLTFGAKRNVLIDAAKGEYIGSVDDDDALHPQFLELVLAAIEQKPDVIGYKVACYGYAQTNGQFDPSIMEPADVSIKWDGWYNDRGGFKYVRCPHHIVPVRAEHVRAIGFQPMHHGEDHEYSIRMRDSGRLKSEVYIDEFMYVYRFSATKKKGE